LNATIQDGLLKRFFFPSSNKNKMSSEQTAIKATYFSIIGNTSLWWLPASSEIHALIADAIESTADIFASFLVLFGIKYSNKPADENHPYGHGRAEPLITFWLWVS
jgi:divalent metal cation (Fe/Co/Zn/Cd) transporter